MKSFILFLVLLFSQQNLFCHKSGQELIDSLTNELNIVQTDEQRLEIIRTLSFKLYSVNPERGIKLAEDGLAIARQLRDEQGIADIYRSLATNYWSMGLYDSALEYYIKALEINEKFKNKQGIASCLGNIGMIYSSQQNHEKSLEYYSKALEINEQIGNKKSIASIYINLGIIYENLGDYKKSLEYYNHALTMSEELENERSIATIMHNIGAVYQILKEYDNTLKYYERAYIISEEIGDSRLKVQQLINMGLLYIELGNEADSLGRKSEGIVYQKKALKCGLEAEAIAEKNNITNISYLIDEAISKVYENLGNYEKSLYYFKRFKNKYDEISSAEVTLKMSKITNQYQKDKEEREAEEAARIAQEERNYRNTLQYSGVSVLVLLLVVGLFFSKRMNFKPTMIETIMFLTFLLFYEFILVLTEPPVDNFTEEIPIFKLGINLAIALLFIPFHRFEKKLRMKMLTESR